MPLSIVKRLSLGELTPTTMTLLMADGTMAQLEGILEDVLNKEGEFIFPVVFVVIDMEEDKHILLLLGKPFLATRATLIYVKKGELTLIIGDEKVHFNLNQSLKQPGFDNVDCKNVEQVVLISPELIYDCKIQNSTNENEVNFQYIEAFDVDSSLEFKVTILSLKEVSTEKSSSNEEKGQEVKKSYEGFILEEFSKLLKYAFLGAEKAHPVIIASDLTIEKEKKMIGILIKYKEAIGWSIEYLKGISPLICMNKILL